jgi:hypothetical protein
MHSLILVGYNSAMTSRRKRELWIALLLPLLTLRALLPVGHMPTVADGNLRIVMCSAGIGGTAGDTRDGGAGFGSMGPVHLPFPSAEPGDAPVASD